MPQNKNQNDEQSELQKQVAILEKDMETMSDEQKDFINDYLVTEALYEGVVNHLNIDHDDLKFREEVLSLLRLETQRNLALSIWTHLSDEQSVELKGYLDQQYVLEPELDSDTFVIQYAQKYPNLMEKVYVDIDKFFDTFVERFNKIHEPKK